MLRLAPLAALMASGARGAWGGGGGDSTMDRRFATAHLPHPIAMSVGILSFPSVQYGTWAQHFCLQEAFERRGHVVHTIRLLDNPGSIWDSQKFAGHTRDECHETILEIDTSGSPGHNGSWVTSEWTSSSSSCLLKNPPKTGDLILLGSDRIWDPAITGTPTSVYFGHALRLANPNTTIASFSASFGGKPLRAAEAIAAVRSLRASRLDDISTRDGPAAVQLRRYGVQAQHLLDPTTVQDCSLWRRFSSTPPKKTSLVFYGYEDRFNSAYEGSGWLQTGTSLEAICSKVNLSTFCAMAGVTHAYHIHPFSGVREVNIDACGSRGSGKPLTFSTRLAFDAIKTMAHARYIITNTFHGCMLSLLNKRPFSVVGVRPVRAGTVGDLLQTLGLEARVLKEPLTLETLYAGLVKSTIDYGAVESRLAPYRSRMDAYISNITALATLKMRPTAAHPHM